METLTNRLETFADWPSHIPVKPREIAEAGFYYIGRGQDDDKVCCFSCKGIVCKWKSGDSPEDVHQQRFGNKCAFIQRRMLLEQPVNNLMSSSEKYSITTDYGQQATKSNGNYDPLGDEAMEIEEQRLRSFKRNHGWPGRVSSAKLAKAGFYFTGVNDYVKCFKCDLGLQKWEAEDDPMIEHVRYQPTCPFVVEMSRHGIMVPMPALYNHQNGGGLGMVIGNSPELQSYQSIPPEHHRHTIPTTNVPTTAAFVSNQGNITTISGNGVQSYQQSANMPTTTFVSHQGNVTTITGNAVRSNQNHHQANVLPSPTNIPPAAFGSSQGNTMTVTGNPVQSYQSSGNYHHAPNMPPSPTKAPPAAFGSHQGNVTTISGNHVGSHQQSGSYYNATGSMPPPASNVPNTSYINHHSTEVNVTGTSTPQSPTNYHHATSSMVPNVGAHNAPHSTPFNKKPNPSQPANYSSEHTRLHSFINWPKECPVQPKELIDAGFYHTGEEDQARCFKCGITLAGWEAEDTPWGEHEKWSRDCPLVQERLLQRNPHATNLAGYSASILPKEQTWQVPREHAIADKTPETGKGSCKNSTPTKEASETSKARKASEQSEWSPENGKLNNKPKVGKNIPHGSGREEVFFLQKAVQELIERGYDYGKICETIQYKTKFCNENINSLEELLDAFVLYSEGDNEPRKADDDVMTDSAPTSPISGEQSGFSLAVGTKDLHREFEKMQEVHTCKICLDAEIGVLFLPCGHLVCCPNCASTIQMKSPALCPMCRKHIDSSIRTFLS